MCGILFLTEGSGQPQLSRVFQDAPKRRTLSNTASHTGLSPSHTEIVARPVCVACLCWREHELLCVCVRACGLAIIRWRAVADAAQATCVRGRQKKKQHVEFRIFLFYFFIGRLCFCFVLFSIGERLLVRTL